jgi:hypothetical protein
VIPGSAWGEVIMAPTNQGVAGRFLAET